jgi:hypothetical protein
MDRMHRLADEIREVFEDRGWKIDKAVRSDEAFSKTRRPSSALTRALVLHAVVSATSRLELGRDTVCGGGCDVTDIVGTTERRFRVLKADVDPETGNYDIISGSDALMVMEAEPESLYTLERWVLGYTVDDEGIVADIFAARAEDITDDSVPHLVLGPVTLLGTGALGNPPTGGGFQPPAEDDLGAEFNDGDSDGDTGESRAG